MGPGAGAGVTAHPRKARSGRKDMPLSGREQLLDAAAALFGAKGFDGTSVREIGAAVGMSAPALYHHFASKEDIFCATHEKGMRVILEAVEAALSSRTDPWDRLEAAAIAHCNALLVADGYRTIITPQFPDVSGEIRAKLIGQRDAYEVLTRRLIADLPLAPDVDHAMVRMHYLGALNWTTMWYRPGGDLTPRDIARQVVRHLRHGIDAAPEGGPSS